MPHPIWVVDAFTLKPFTGNPAAVVLLDSAPQNDEILQSLAAEMRHSETCFVWPISGYDDHDAASYGLRWFTPTCEVDLCGHGTLSSAWVLWESQRVSRSQSILFYAPKAGHELHCRHREGNRVVMTFPAKRFTSANPHPEMLEALRIPRYQDAVYCDDGTWLLALDAQSAVFDLKPDFDRLRAISSDCVIVTATSTLPDVDVVSRFFAPAHGIDEDPVTGSAHCLIGPYWQARLSVNPLRCVQVSARSGYLNVKISDRSVQLQGDVVPILSGTCHFNL